MRQRDFVQWRPNKRFNLKNSQKFTSKISMRHVKFTSKRWEFAQCGEKIERILTSQ